MIPKKKPCTLPLGVTGQYGLINQYRKGTTKHSDKLNLWARSLTNTLNTTQESQQKNNKPNKPMDLVEQWNKMYNLVMGMQGDVTKVENSSTKASARRARKACQELKVEAQVLRKKLQEAVS